MNVDATSARVLRAMRLADVLGVEIEAVWRMSKRWDALFLPVRVVEPLR